MAVGPLCLIYSHRDTYDAGSSLNAHVAGVISNEKLGLVACVGKFRPWLIELTSFKPKLLIRFIMNKTC